MSNSSYDERLAPAFAPTPWQKHLQTAGTTLAEDMLEFHDYLSYYLIFIGCVVFWILFVTVLMSNDWINETPKVFAHSTTLEIVWTVIPAIILVFIGWPSFVLLYKSETMFEKPLYTIKVIGHQWYWTYEYVNHPTGKTPIAIVEYINGKAKRFFQRDLDEKPKLISFDSYMLKSKPKNASSFFRLLEVDNKLVLPINTPLRLLVTSSDVIHCWAVPSLGLKIDACPGRLAQAYLQINFHGKYFGQCSEICGVNHGFMPIVILACDRLWHQQSILPLFSEVQVEGKTAKELSAIGTGILKNIK